MLSSALGDYFLLPSQPEAFMHSCAGRGGAPWSGTRPFSHWKFLVAAFMLLHLWSALLCFQLRSFKTG